MIKVSFDASVLFSAIYSKTGGSAKLASFTQQGKIIGITSQTVLEELRENLTKLKISEPKIISDFILRHRFLVREEIKPQDLKSFLFVKKKDVHVLAGAILTQSDYLVTLDKKHLDNPKIKAIVKKPLILSPKELLKKLLGGSFNRLRHGYQAANKKSAYPPGE